LFANKICSSKEIQWWKGLHGASCSIDLAEKLENQLQKSVQQGAKIIVGGAREIAIFNPH
jgi:hypothetical protein